MNEFLCFKTKLFFTGNNHGQPENSTPGTEDAAESQTSTQLASEDQSISQEVKTTNNSSSVAAHEKKKIDVMKNMPSNITNESLGSYVEKLFVVKSRRPLSALREQKRAVLKAKETAIKKEDRGESYKYQGYCSDKRLINKE